MVKELRVTIGCDAHDGRYEARGDCAGWLPGYSHIGEIYVANYLFNYYGVLCCCKIKIQLTIKYLFNLFVT